MKKRQANFELLRIVAMYMVLVMHYLNYHVGSLFFDLGLHTLTVTAVVLDSFCIVAVNAFVMLSGYFLSVKSFSLRRWIGLLCQMLFYTLLIPPLLVFLGVLSPLEARSISHIWNCLFPIQSGHYWFMSSYMVLLLFTPFLNVALEKLDQKKLRNGILFLLVIFSVGKSLSPLYFATDRYGYDLGWFLVLYLAGGYFRRFGVPYLKTAARGFGVYLASVGVIALLEMGLMGFAGRLEGLRYYTSVPFHYNFLPCFVGAVGLFSGFAHLQIQNERLAGAIRRVSPAVLGVYLIHEQMDIALRWYDWIDALTAPFGLSVTNAFLAGEGPTKALWFLAALFVQTAIVFVLCVGIDGLRGLLFAWIGKKWDKRRTEGT